MTMRSVWKTHVRLIVLASFLPLAAWADWNPGDPYKMHFPQLPDLTGWDVAVQTASPPPPAAVADDWLCTASGPVSDIHIWFSMRGDVGPALTLNSLMAFSIWSDVPATSGQFSRPGTLLWSQIFSPANFTIRPYAAGNQGWYDPNQGLVVPNDHQQVWQLNLTGIANPFMQQQGTTYWLGVNFEPGVWGGEPGWKTSVDHYNDSAVWWDFTNSTWNKLVDPVTGQGPIDMAFVITTIPEPGCLSLFVLGGGLWGLRLLRRRTVA
jgi:hypothetical protein